MPTESAGRGGYRVTITEWEWANLPLDEIKTLVVVRIRKMLAGVKGRGPHGDE